MAHPIVNSIYHPTLRNHEIVSIKSISKITQEYKKYLNLVQLPFKLVNSSFYWFKKMPAPFSKEAKEFLAFYEHVAKQVSLTFFLPKFVISHVAFYNTFQKWKKEQRGDLTVNLFFSSVSCFLSAVSLSNMIVKLKLFNLDPVKKRIPHFMTRVSKSLSLISLSKKFVDASLELGKQARLVHSETKKDLYSKEWGQTGFSLKTLKAMEGLVAKSLKFTSLGFSLAASVTGIAFNPLLLKSISTTAFIMQLFQGMESNACLIFGKEPPQYCNSIAHLPA